VSRRLGHRTDRDAESGVSAIEFVLYTPLLFLLLIGTVQFGMFFFARHVAIAAAQEADRTARAEAADPGAYNWEADATATGNQWIKTLAPNLLTGSQVCPYQTVGRQWTVSVVVTGKVPEVAWGLSMSVKETSTGVVEQFISAAGVGISPPVGPGVGQCP
jgi:Flp pilus assembly protein TadG